MTTSLRAGLIDVHTHVVPKDFPPLPQGSAESRWPCMKCHSVNRATIMMGAQPFRELDDRSWGAARRIEDMDRDGVGAQVLSPMPELLSYWFDPADGHAICDHVNANIAELVAFAPDRFTGIGMVPLQDMGSIGPSLERLKNRFGLVGVEIGSNILGATLGERRFDPFYEAAESLGLVIFVHALHPIATKSVNEPPWFTFLPGFSIDVGMAGASLIMSGVLERFPKLRIGLSHGGGVLGALVGRLDQGWRINEKFRQSLREPPSAQFRRLFYDTNSYDPAYIRHLTSQLAPDHVFLGTDYPYDIMQEDPAAYIRSMGLDEAARKSVSRVAAERFLGDSPD